MKIYRQRIHEAFMGESGKHLRQGVTLSRGLRPAKQKHIRKLCRYAMIARNGTAKFI